MSNRRNIDILGKIVNYCDEIADTIQHFGDTFDKLEASKIYKNAAAMCVLQIGELAGHLSEDFRAAYPEMPWRNMRGMRNIAAHRYGDFDLETLWGTITVSIPALSDYCSKIITQHEILQQDCIEEIELDEEIEQTIV